MSDRTQRYGADQTITQFAKGEETARMKAAGNRGAVHAWVWVLGHMKMCISYEVTDDYVKAIR